MEATMAGKKSNIKRMVFVIHLTLREGEDDALIALMRHAPPRGVARTVRETMRRGIAKSDKLSFKEIEFTRET
jgi:hypothetical protein